MAASLHTSIPPRSFLPLSKSRKGSSRKSPLKSLPPPHPSAVQKPNRIQILLRNKHRNWGSCAVVRDEIDLIPVQSEVQSDQQEGAVVMVSETVGDGNEAVVVGFGAATSEGRLSLEGFPNSVADVGDERIRENEEMQKTIDRTINATIVLAAGTFAITKLLTIDHDYWQVSVQNRL